MTEEGDSLEAEARPRKVKPRLPPTTAQWWREQPGREPHDVVHQILQQIRQRQSWRYDAYKFWCRLYGADMSGYGDIAQIQEIFGEVLALNEAANALETLHAHVYRHRIVPSPSTVGGDWGAQQRAKLLGRWLDGAFDETSIFDEHLPHAGMLALVCGTGLLKGSSVVHGDEGELRVESIPPWDVYVDSTEGRYGRPRSIYHTLLVDRYVLLDRYGVADDAFHGTVSQRAQAIEEQRDGNDFMSMASPVTDGATDQIPVMFAWHLPSGPHSDDGKFFLGIRSCTLEYRAFRRKRFPLVAVRWGVPLASYYGDSAMRRIAPAQREYDKLNERLQTAHDIMGVPRILKQRGAKISAGHIENVPGSIIDCDDINGIKEWNATPIHPEVYSYRGELPNSMRGILGVSDYAAQGDIPAGLRQASGVALERYEDTEQARLAMPHRHHERAIIELAEVLIDEATELAEQGISVQVRARDRRSFEPVSWVDVALDRKEYVLRLPPASALPRTPAAKQQRLVELLDKGAITVQTFRRWSELGDVDELTDLDTADEEIILRTLQHMVDTGEYVRPLTLDDLEHAIALAGKFFSLMRLKRVPNDRLALISQYIDEARLEQAKKAPPPPPPGPPGMPPPGPPMSPNLNGGPPMPGPIPPTMGNA